MADEHYFEKSKNSNMSATDWVILTKFGPNQPTKIQILNFEDGRQQPH